MLVCTAMLCEAQTRRALLIGISDYNMATTEWSPIHGTNDVALLKAALTQKGVRSITELRDAQATYSGICSALETLIARTASGDIVYVHMSGHGQPVEDYDGDERGKDEWDEAFVPYDAPKCFARGRYEGDRHLTDDILNRYVERLRMKAGREGAIYVSIDACHSGDSYRDDDDDCACSAVYETIKPEDLDGGSQPAWSTCSRGSAEGMSRHGKVYSASDAVTRETVLLPKDARKAPLAMLESCLSTQRSYELTVKMRGQDFHCGPLSYVIYKVMTSGNDLLSSDMSWVRRVRTEFARALPGNNPQKLVIETTEQSLCH